MPFLSKEGSAAIAPKATGGYLSPQSITAGSSVRFALLQATPTEYWQVWLQDKHGNLNDKGKVIKKPLRFAYKPTEDDIAAELGDQWERELNYKEDGVGPCKFNIAVAVYSHDSESVLILTSDKSSVNRAFDSETQAIDREDDYEDILAPDWILGREGTGLNTEYSLRTAPRKKGTNKNIQDAWNTAVKEGFDISRMLTNGNPFKAEDA